jgi:hypothetical protein
MDAGRHTIRCRILCDSPGDLRAVEALATRKVMLDSAIDEKTVSYSGGVETLAVRRHVLRDLFDAVELQSDRTGDTGSVGIVFHTRPGADPYWGDVVARVLRGIVREASTPVRIEFVT